MAAVEVPDVCESWMQQLLLWTAMSYRVSIYIYPQGGRTQPLGSRPWIRRAPSPTLRGGQVRPCLSKCQIGFGLDLMSCLYTCPSLLHFFLLSSRAVVLKEEVKMVNTSSWLLLVSVPDPKPTPARIAFVILEAIYAPDEVWGRD